ncbi:MAG: diguanylate cyclase [Candidatus Lambdaproteobacteria bacterium]|nr:diguanylate cyclase [Candidatus Lambdaproteobacteria bacterium]
MTQILIVAENPDNLTIASMVLARDRYEIVTADSGAEALRKVQEAKPDVILLDIVLPELDGFEVCRRLKADPATRHIPVAFLSSDRTDIDSISHGLELGAEDYIVKPFSSVELRSRLKVLARLKKNVDELFRKNAELQEANQALEQANAELASTKKELEQLAITDPLTGLYNRRYFDERMNEAFSLIPRSPMTIHFLSFDLDHFKRVNDQHGHHMGDLVLVQFSNILRRFVRKNDIIARIGGEEFVIAMLQIPAYEAHRAAERIRSEMEMRTLGGEGVALRMTTSVGVASYPEVKLDPPTPGALLKVSDDALYQAKNTGRNRIVIAAPSGSA